MNSYAILMLPGKRGDKCEVLSAAKLANAIRLANIRKGVYRKAAALLSAVIIGHPFASANRRAAFIATQQFLLENYASSSLEDSPENAEILLGIRQRFYKVEEIATWIETGDIREFNKQAHRGRKGPT
jgi:prophage maintenance system killer protein